MASEEEEKRQLRTRIGSILKSSACLAIRFKLDNICIGRYMYTYIGHSIMTGGVCLKFGGSNFYDHRTNTLTLESVDVKSVAIVHEATHALINATHVGKVIQRASHEAAAYLAETMWAMMTGTEHSIDVPGMRTPLRRLAARVNAFNQANPSGLFNCPSSETSHIKAVLGGSRAGGTVDEFDEQLGIGDGPKPKGKAGCPPEPARR